MEKPWRVFLLMAVQHTGSRSLYKMFYHNKIKPVKLDERISNGLWAFYRQKKKNGIICYGHPFSNHIEAYDELRARKDAICITMVRPYEEVEASWRRRYGEPYKRGTSWIYQDANSFDISLDKQWEYWEKNVKPNSICIDVHNPYPELRKLEIEGHFPHIGSTRLPTIDIVRREDHQTSVIRG